MSATLYNSDICEYTQADTNRCSFFIIMYQIKNIVIIFFLMLVPVGVTAQYQKAQEKAPLVNVPLENFASQQKVLFNFGWKFQLVTNENKNTDFASPALDDSSWRTLDLPHDFQFEQPWTENGGGARGFKPMCEGWYRKSFPTDPSWKGKRVVLDFGGIIYLGDVYLNGTKIASTDYGYVGLEADLTPFLRHDGENVVAVYASTGPKKGSRWYTGGGLFRDVYLQVQNPTHIARHGVYITTPEVSSSRATVAVQVEVDGWQKHDVRVRTTLRNPEGVIVGSVQSGMPEHTHQTCTEVKLPALTLENPQLWSCESPQLYNAEVVVTADGMVVDSLTEQFGIRSLEFSPEFGFKLNGKKIFLQGNANHHDLGALGATCYDKAIERMMLQLKSFGYNCIRCSHNPYSDSFARIADRVGILVVDELTDKWSDNDYWGGRQPFTHIWHKLITEWIKRDRNRPSIILWSLGNELQIREGWAGFEGTNDWGITTYNIFNQLVKRWDHTRLTTVAMFPARAGAITRHDKEFNDYLVPPELACATEVASFNYQSDKYDAYLKYRPDLILFQSEAETSNLLQPYYNMDKERMVGIAYWGSVEYWGESNKWPKKGWNYSFFEHTMRPYPQAYLIKTAFMPEIPEVHIGVVDAAGAESVSWNDVIVGRMALNECWNHTPGSRRSLFTFTNAHSVELLVNGQSMGIQKNDTTRANLRNMIYWKDVPYGNGGSVVAIARDKSGKEVARHRIETAGKAVALRIEAETPTDWKADGMDLQYINVTVIDKKGRPVWDYNEPLTLQMEGAARLVALDNGDHYTDELFHGITSKRMYQGRMQIILRSDQEAGNVTVKISSAGLKGTLRLKTINE